MRFDESKQHVSCMWRSRLCKSPTTSRQPLAKLSGDELRRVFLSLLTLVLPLGSYSTFILFSIPLYSNDRSAASIIILLHPPLPSLYFYIAYFRAVHKISKWFPWASCGAVATVSVFGYFLHAILSPIVGVVSIETWSRLVILRFISMSPNDAQVSHGKALIASRLPSVGSHLLILAEIELRSIIPLTSNVQYLARSVASKVSTIYRSSRF